MTMRMKKKGRMPEYLDDGGDLSGYLGLVTA